MPSDDKQVVCGTCGNIITYHKNDVEIYTGTHGERGTISCSVCNDRIVINLYPNN